MDSALRLYAWNLRFARALVADLSDSACTEPAGPGLENHPAWTIGHLVTGAAILAEDLGLSRDLPQGWADLFLRRGPGDPRLPDPDRDLYPPMADLLAELGRQHERVAEAWRAAVEQPGVGPADLDSDLAWRFAADLPTLGDAALFLAVSHEALHLGQLSAWRRARGLPSALAQL